LDPPWILRTRDLHKNGPDREWAKECFSDIGNTIQLKAWWVNDKESSTCYRHLAKSFSGHFTQTEGLEIGNSQLLKSLGYLTRFSLTNVQSHCLLSCEYTKSVMGYSFLSCPAQSQKWSYDANLFTWPWPSFGTPT